MNALQLLTVQPYLAPSHAHYTAVVLTRTPHNSFLLLRSSMRRCARSSKGSVVSRGTHERPQRAKREPHSTSVPTTVVGELIAPRSVAQHESYTTSSTFEALYTSEHVR